MLWVGLTGGTGAGKSSVARRLARFGAQIIDADALAREVVAVGTPGLAAVVDAFGDVLNADGELDRAAMAAIVFADRQRLADLEAITHPLIEDRTRQLRAAAADDAVVVHDMPLIVEKGTAADYHLVIVVDAPVQTRIERLSGRGMPPDDARRRIAGQADERARREVADVWLDNAGDPEDLDPVLEKLWERLLGFETNLRAGRVATRPSTVRIVDPDPTWAAQAARLLARVRRVGGDIIAAEHIGSTSVPGLPAEDVIDLQVVVADLDRAGALGRRLAAVGLIPHPERCYDELIGGGIRDKVLWGSADPGRTVNLHIRDAANPQVAQSVLVRDRLRADPQLAARYAELKRRLAATTGGVQEYARAKSGFIASAVRPG
jgi:dephospho-CoA kinase